MALDLQMQRIDAGFAAIGFRDFERFATKAAAAMALGDEQLVDETAKRVRSFVLAKELREEFTLELQREQALDLYLHVHEFAEQRRAEPILEGVLGSLKDYILRSQA